MLSNTKSEVYEFDGFRIDAGKRLLWNSGEPVALPPKAFDTLFYLVKNAGKTINKDQLMAAIWPETVVEENNLNKNISTLRQLLGEKPKENRFIVTVPGKGYKFVASVVEIPVNGFPADLAPPDGPPPGLIPAKTTTAGERRRARFSYLRYAPVATAAIILLFAVALYLRHAAKSPRAGPIRSIAVLPFQPIAGESRTEAMQFGMADSLITQLSKTSDLVVRPFSATRRYAATGRDPAEIGQNLGVDAVLEGSVQVSEGWIRITTRLIRTSDGKQIWAENFDEQMRDVFAVQDSITQRVAVALNAKLGKQSRKGYTEDVESADETCTLAGWTGGPGNAHEGAPLKPILLEWVF